MSRRAVFMVTVIGLGGAGIGASAATALMGHRSGSSFEKICPGGIGRPIGDQFASSMCYDKFSYHGAMIRLDEFRALKRSGHVAGTDYTGTSYLFDTQAEYMAFLDRTMRARRRTIQDAELVAVRRCFGPLSTDEHGLTSSLVITGNRVRVWRLPRTSRPPTAASVAWGSKFTAPPLHQVRTHGHDRLVVWSWSRRPTQAQDTALRARLATCAEGVPTGGFAFSPSP